MNKFFSAFFMTLGVIFFILILCGVYVYLADPFNVRSLFTGSTVTVATTTESGKEVVPVTTESAAVTDKHPALSSEQETALESLGVDPASIPRSVSPEQEACFEQVLGVTRVAEIKAGSVPSVVEVLSARDCLQ